MTSLAKHPRNNPFLAEPIRAVDENVPTHAAPSLSTVETVGPPIPPGTTQVVPRNLKRQPVSSMTDTVFVVGLHGGAGVSTACRILGQDWIPAPTRVVPQVRSVNPSKILFVARTSGIGLAGAEQAAQEWGAEHFPEYEYAGMLLVPDGPRVARLLKPKLTRVSRMWPCTWRLPWIPQWHLEAEPSIDPNRLPVTVKLIRSRIKSYFFPELVPDDQTAN